MSDSVEGGCQCNAIRYRIEGEPLALAVCHCKECQRQSGSAFGMILIVRDDSFRVLTGELSSFTRSANQGGQVECLFCPGCGTRIYHKPSSRQGTVNVKAGTLDDTSKLAPSVHVWTTRKQGWVPIPEDARCFAEQPRGREDPADSGPDSS